MRRTKYARACNRRLTRLRLKTFRAVAWAVALYAAYAVLSAPYEPIWTPLGGLLATAMGLTLKRTGHRRSARRPSRHT